MPAGGPTSRRHFFVQKPTSLLRRLVFYFVGRPSPLFGRTPTALRWRAATLELLTLRSPLTCLSAFAQRGRRPTYERPLFPSRARDVKIPPCRPGRTLFRETG